MVVMKQIKVEVAYAKPGEQKIIALRVEEGCTIGEAIELSRVREVFPEIDLGSQKVGVFGKIKKLTDKVRDGDRVEVYRGLVIDPKEARRKRAK